MSTPLEQLRAWVANPGFYMAQASADKLERIVREVEKAFVDSVPMADYIALGARLAEVEDTLSRVEAACVRALKETDK